MLECCPREETKIKRPCWGYPGPQKEIKGQPRDRNIPSPLFTFPWKPPEPLVCHASGRAGTALAAFLFCRLHCGLRFLILPGCPPVYCPTRAGLGPVVPGSLANFWSKASYSPTKCRGRLDFLNKLMMKGLALGIQFLFQVLEVCNTCKNKQTASQHGGSTSNWH